MSADLFLDVELEIPVEMIPTLADPSSYAVEQLRRKADEVCDRHGAKLRTDRAPEFLVQQASRIVDGVSVVVVSSRWAIVAPDSLAARVGRDREPAE